MGRRGATWAALALALALAAPGIALAHDGATAGDHAEEDSVVTKDPATETRLSNATVARSRADAQAAAAAVVGNEGDVGQWGPVVDWPVVAIHDALLPNGKVVAWDASNDNDLCNTTPLPWSCSYTKTTDYSFTRATVYDPATGTQTAAWVSGHNIFCAGLAHLPDGRLFTAGGNADQFSNGIVNTYTFNSANNAWTLGADMQYPRWYPTVTPLTNGEMLITGGRPWIPEVRRADGSIRVLSEQTGTMDVPFYPWMDVGPDGRVFYAGPDDHLRKLDPSGAGAWQDFGTRDGENRDYGSHALYDVGKILVAGGGPSSRTARTIDINGTTPQVSTTSPMAFGRRQFNLTTLADGTVLATGGNSTGAQYVDMNGGVYNAELWNSATGQWKTLAAEQVTRQYHSTALLLPDGRVLSAGGGVCDICDTVGYLGKNAQIFTPPYLFKQDGSGELAPRPAIGSAPSAVPYGTQFQISTANGVSIRKVALLRLGAVTHSTNMDQRYVPLSFSAGSGQLTATSPQNANVAPPGVYMLFIVDDAGVPSVAKMVSVSASAPPPPPPPNQPPAVTLTQPPNGATFTAPATVSLAATASDADGTVAKVEFFNGTTKLGEDTTAPYAFTWTGVGPGTYSLTARATDNLGGTATSSASTITVNAGSSNQLPTASITSPINGAVIPWKANLTITITATASDSDGTVTKVEFLDGTTVLGRDTTAPYSFAWNKVKAGSHSLSARATDNAGAVGTSAPVSITVKK
jgi:Galactose oxidase-like, Early set domain/Bacterial Ig domain/Glyoxal oxidase N-terminus